MKMFLVSLKWLKKHKIPAILLVGAMLFTLAYYYIFFMYFPAFDPHTIYQGIYNDCGDLIIDIHRAISVDFYCKMNKRLSRNELENLILKLTNCENGSVTLLRCGDYNQYTNTVYFVCGTGTSKVICSSTKSLYFFDSGGAYYLPPGRYSVTLAGDFTKHDDCVWHISVNYYTCYAVKKGIK